jgi:GNAT superfamily N-acetyltransferase
MQIKIAKAEKKDLKEMAQIASESFSGLREKNPPNGGALKWIECNFGAYPRMQYFTAIVDGQLSGYILWTERGGFRKESVFELEQIAVDQKLRGKGVATKLINDSFADIKKYVELRGAVLKSVEVSTGVHNGAQKLYKKTLGVEIECTIKDRFREDEVLMIARFSKK